MHQAGGETPIGLLGAHLSKPASQHGAPAYLVQPV